MKSVTPKSKMPKIDLFFDPWPLTFWPLTLILDMWQAIHMTHILWKFHPDIPSGKGWKAVDSLTHGLTKSIVKGERCHPKRNPRSFFFYSLHYSGLSLIFQCYKIPATIFKVLIQCFSAKIISIMNRSFYATNINIHASPSFITMYFLEVTRTCGWEFSLYKNVI